MSFTGIRLLVLIDGLYVAGETPEVTLPTLARLAAVGEGGRVDWGHGNPPSADRALFCLFDQDGAAEDLPLGFVTAQGMGVAPDPEWTWGCLGFTHLLPKRNELIFLSPERTGQTATECWTLAEALTEPLREGGWRLHGGPASPLVVSSQQPLMARTHSLEGLDGKPLHTFLPQGRDGQGLLQTLTAGQMILARHPLNLQRSKEGRMPLNTPWIWGLGDGRGLAGAAGSGVGGRCWSDSPLLAGLAALAGFAHAALHEAGGITPERVVEIAASPGIGLVYVRLPGVLARHGMARERRERLAALDASLLAPLAGLLAKRGGLLLVATPEVLAGDGGGGGTPAPWVAAHGRALARGKRFWQRRRLGEGAVLSVDDFRKRWLG